MKKKFFILGLIGIFLTFVLIYSCNYDTLSPIDDANKKSIDARTCTNYLIAPLDSFNSFNFDYIGEKHNEMLLTVMQDLHRSNDYSIERIMYNFNNLGFTYDSITLLNTYGTFTTDSYDNVISHLSSNEAKMFYNNIFISLDSASNLSDFRNKLDANFLNAQNASLCPADLKIIEGSSSIAKYSALFWAPREWGGQGNYDRYANKELRARWKWGNAALGDIAGCGTGMIIASLTVGFFGGPVGGAYLFGVIATTVASSTFGGAGIPG